MRLWVAHRSAAMAWKPPRASISLVRCPFAGPPTDGLQAIAPIRDGSMTIRPTVHPRAQAARAASIPFIVSRRQLISANSLYSGGFTIAQIAGLVILSPIILKAAGPGVLFASAAGALLIFGFAGIIIPVFQLEIVRPYNQD